MYKHHEDTIKNISNKLESREDVLAVIIGGSIAQGFETEKSDIDIMIIVSEDDYQSRLKTGDIHYYEKESCTYVEGYIDGKYISVDFIKKVIEFGSEPARFAFKGAFTTFSKIEGLDELLNAVAKYTVNDKQNKIDRFYAQFQAWNWYCHEALKYNNKYLLNHSISNLILFGGRLILAYNEELYPYHKRFLRILENVEYKPENLMINLNKLLNEPSKDNIVGFYSCVEQYKKWNVNKTGWPNLFMKDCELNWLYGEVPIADA